MRLLHPLARAQALQWIFFEQYSHEPNIATARHGLTHGVPMSRAPAASRNEARAGHAALAVMGQYLARNP
ncbi:MAG TPA: hypothetical protein VIL43_13970 [Burkholderiales bacterium]